MRVLRGCVTLVCLLAAGFARSSSAAGEGVTTKAANAAPAVSGKFAPASMAYVLQGEGLSKNRAEAVRLLAQCGRDLIVVDYSYDGGAGGKWTPEEIAAIRNGKPGRKVVAYISIGEAEDYRDYWKREWDKDKDGKPDPGAPAFLCAANPDWKGNYRVRYWNKDWQAIILRYVDAVVAQGFDGMYMDIVDGFEFFEEDKGDWIDNRPNPETGSTYRRDMIEWVKTLATRARAQRKDFILIAQNASQLLEHPDYLETISAIGCEDLFTNGNKKQKTKETDYILGFLKKAQGRIPILCIEYCKKPDLREFVMQEARKNGIVLLITDRNLKTLGESGEKQ